jgi:triacylglycerol esterase/lipase EstA (alpha/beta hydrolase family)
MNLQTQTLKKSFWNNFFDTFTRAYSGTYTWIKDCCKNVDPEFRNYLTELPIFGLTQLASSQTPSTTLKDDGNRLIVFVHGIAGHRGNFLPMQKYFNLMGRKRTVSIGFPNNNSIEEMAEYLRKTITQLVKENNLPKKDSIEIVTHSMGGIVARYALQDSSFAAKVSTLVTLGTPHQGTHLARYLDTLKIKELRPSSNILQKLDYQIPWGNDPKMPRMVCFWSPNDLILLPPQSALIDGAEEISVPESTHLGFLLKPKIWSKILNVLNPKLS